MGNRDDTSLAMELTESLRLRAVMIDGEFAVRSTMCNLLLASSISRKKVILDKGVRPPRFGEQSDRLEEGVVELTPHYTLIPSQYLDNTSQSR